MDGFEMIEVNATGAKGVSPLTEMLCAEMAALLAAGDTTKRSAVRLALLKAMREGVLAPGDRLPPETELAGQLGVSVGTIQAALGQLQDLGQVVRRRGDGTRVAGDTDMASTVWHFRFIDRETGKPFRVLDQSIELLQTDATGPWTDHLGACPSYTVIRRSMTGECGHTVGAEMYFDAGFISASQIQINELKATNVRTVIEKSAGVRAVRGTHMANCVRLSDRHAALFSLPFGAECFQIDACTHTSGGRPLYFQRIYAPVDAFSLYF